MPSPDRRAPGTAAAVCLLAPGQVVSWGSLYYAIAFLAGPIHRETGWPLKDIFLAFSAGLLVAALAAVPVGRMLSRYGARPVLVAGSLAGALALTVIAHSHDLLVFTLGWALAGAAMAMSQYEAAFSALRVLVPGDFRRAIGWLTIAGGLASTVFWPLTLWLAGELGWRPAVLLYAGLHLVPAMFLHGRLPPQTGERGGEGVKDSRGIREASPASRAAGLLALTFAVTSMVTSAVSSQAGRILEQARLADGMAIFILAAIGPMQVAGRLIDLGLAGKYSVASTGLAALGALVLGLLCLDGAQWHPLFALGFAVAYGIANGMLTVVRGNAPAEFMPGHDYAVSLGIISWSALLARGLSPYAAVWLVETWSVRALQSTLIVLSLLALWGFFAAIRAAGAGSREQPDGGANRDP